MYKLIFVSFLITLQYFSFAQTCWETGVYPPTRILREFNVGFVIGRNDTLPCEKEIWLREKNKLKVKVLHCWGECLVEHIDVNDNIVACGYYMNSLDTLKRYDTVIVVDDIGRELVKVRVTKYFVPLRDGIWQFYYPAYHERRYNKGVWIRE